MMITYDWGTTQRKKAAQRARATQEKINAENHITIAPDVVDFTRWVQPKISTFPPEKRHAAMAYYWVRFIITRMLGDDEPDQPTHPRHTAFLIGDAFEGVANG